MVTPDNSILDPNEKINSSDKDSSKDVDSGGRSAVATAVKNRITAYNSDDNNIDLILNKKSNRVLFDKKKKGSSQRGPGNKVPSHLNDSPFAIIIPDPNEKNNSSDKNSSKKVASGGRAALKADKKLDKATVKAKAEYTSSVRRSTICSETIFYFSVDKSFCLC